MKTDLDDDQLETVSCYSDISRENVFRFLVTDIMIQECNKPIQTHKNVIYKII